MTAIKEIQPCKRTISTVSNCVRSRYQPIQTRIHPLDDLPSSPPALTNDNYDFSSQVDAEKGNYTLPRVTSPEYSRNIQLQDELHVAAERDIVSDMSHFDCSVVATKNQPSGCSCPSIALIPKYWNRSGHQTISEALYLSRQKHLLEGTGKWLLRSDTFNKWREMNMSSNLWLHASPGLGKSMLASAVVKNLEGSRRFGDITDFFFCDGRFKATEVILGILSVMVHKLLSRNIDEQSRDRLNALSADLENIGVRLSFSELRSFLAIIKHVLRPHETFFLVLDGVDEIPDSQSGRELLHGLLDFSNSCNPRHRIKIFISSRPDYQPCVSLGGALRVDMDKEPSVQEDLAAYVRNGVQSLQISNPFQDFSGLAERLLSNSNGTFLWASLVLRSLSHDISALNSPDGFSNICATKDIVEIYGHMLRCIPDKDRHTTLTIFWWVIYTSRPLYLDELHFVLATDTDFTEPDIWRISGGLLATSKSQTVSLVHLSVKDYLFSISKENDDWPGKPEQAHEMIARGCLKALSPIQLLQSLNLLAHGSSAMPLPNTEQPSTFAYAHKWIFHYTLAEPHSRSLPGFLRSCLKRSLESEDFRLNGNSASKIPDFQSKINRTCGSTSSSCLISGMILKAASSFGFERLTKLELQMGGNCHLSCQRDGHEALQPLHFAAQGRHISVAKILLDYGADPCAKSSSGHTPLYYAVALGDFEMIRLLLAHTSSIPFAPFNGLQPSPIPRCVRYATETLYLMATISEVCTLCNDKRAHYVVSKPSQNCQDGNIWPPIHIVGEHISLSDISLCSPSWSRSSYQIASDGEGKGERVIIKWFSGADMYNALATAARLGMEDVKNILLAAGNDVKLIDGLTSISQLISNLKIS